MIGDSADVPVVELWLSLLCSLSNDLSRLSCLLDLLLASFVLSFLCCLFGNPSDGFKNDIGVNILSVF